MRLRIRYWFSLLTLVAVTLWTSVLLAFEDPAPSENKAEAKAAQADDASADDASEPTDAPEDSQGEAKEEKERDIALDIGQQALANRFSRFQKTMLQMAEQMRGVDAERADLLFRAISRSQEERIVGQMQAIEALLQRKEFGDSISRQEELVKSLHALLELLQSENRLSEIEAERARIKGILKNVNKLIGKEKDARATTERGPSTERAADQQEDVEEDAQKLIDEVKQQDAERAEKEGDSQSGKSGSDSKDGSGENSKPKDGDQKNGDEPKDGDQKNKDDENKSPDSKDGDQNKEPKDGQPKDGKPKDGQPKDGKPQDGQPQDGQPQDGQPQDGQPQQQQQQTPGREDLEKARDEMQRAIDELRKKKNRKQASRHQDEALRKLLDAKQKLEEILRQLREEEKKLALASLESRFRQMLGMQLLVYQDTVRLEKSTKENDTTLPTRARKLARSEEEIVQEVEKALVILREEGSSVAFPEAVEALREDMMSIVRRLDQAKVGELTQTLEQSVIEGLEEMVDALQKEMEKQREQQQQQQQQQQGQGQDQPLVDQLAELKMLRSLQLRINRRTRQLSRMIEGEAAKDPAIVEQLQVLARRQARVQKAAYELATGRNR